MQPEPCDGLKQETSLSTTQERFLQVDHGLVMMPSQVLPLHVSSMVTDLSTLASVVTTLSAMGKDCPDDVSKPSQVLALSGSSMSTDLSTLASVVTTLAAMGKDHPDDVSKPHNASPIEMLMQAGTVCSQNSRVSETEAAGSRDMMATAFDTLAKACQESSILQPVSVDGESLE